jgi:hypothetical protein
MMVTGILAEDLSRHDLYYMSFIRHWTSAEAIKFYPGDARAGQHEFHVMVVAWLLALAAAKAHMIIDICGIINAKIIT